MTSKLPATTILMTGVVDGLNFPCFICALIIYLYIVIYQFRAVAINDLIIRSRISNCSFRSVI